MPRIPSVRIRNRNGNLYLDYWFQRRRYGPAIGPDTPRMRQLAERKKVEVMHEIAEDIHFPDRRLEHVLFRDFAKDYLAEHAAGKKSVKRITEIVERLVRTFGPRRLAEIAKREIEQYRAKRLREVKPASTNREIAILKHMFNKAIEWEKLEVNPVVGIKLFKETPRVRFLSDEDGEVERLLAACPGWLRPIVEFGRVSGMRLGEILSATWDAVDLKNGILTLPDSKGGEGQIVHLNGRALELLKGLPRGLHKAPVFRGPMGDALKVNWVSRRFRTARKKAKIENFHFHDTRHDFASRLAMEGASLQAIGALLRHKTPAMTQRYAHLSKSHLKDAVRLLDGKPAQQEAQVEAAAKKGGVA